MGDISVKNRDWSGAEELKALSEGTRKVSKDQKKFSVGKK